MYIVPPNAIATLKSPENDVVVNSNLDVSHCVPSPKTSISSELHANAEIENIEKIIEKQIVPICFWLSNGLDVCVCVCVCVGFCGFQRVDKFFTHFRQYSPH